VTLSNTVGVSVL